MSDQKSLQPPKPPNIFLLLKPYKGMIFLLLGFTVLSNGLNLVLPQLMSKGIDSYTQGSFSFSSMIWEFGILTGLIFVFAYLQSVLQTYSSERVGRDLREKLSDKISRQSYLYIQKTDPARLLTNLTSDIDSIKMFVSQAIVSIVSSLFIIVGVSILLLIINWKLALAVLTIIPLIAGTFYVVLRKVRVLFKRSREVVDWLNKVISESILGAGLIRILNSEQHEYQKFLAANMDAKNLGLQILRLFAAMIPIITFVSNLAVLVILALGGHFVIVESMTLGQFVAFSTYVSLLIFPIMIIGFMSNVLAQASVSYQRISEVLDEPDDLKDGELKIAEGNLVVKNLTLTYGEKKALKMVSFEVKPKTKTAILGPTAAGKTQLLYLLTNLTKPTSGSIEFDGREIDLYQKEEFYKQVGFVFQDSIIFNMSLRENIAFNTEVSDENLQKAIETAELDDFIKSLPDGLETIISERGSDLSGGQKQRIMLARALALNPRVLLLDDFTARVDGKTEQKILENVQKNYPGITLISVTQKISSIEHYDHIILLMEGELLAQGTHRALMEHSPEYVQIYNSQRSTSHYEEIHA